MDIIDLLSEVEKATNKGVTLHAFFVDGVLSGWVAHAGTLDRFSGWGELRGIADRLCDRYIVCSKEAA